MKFEKSKDKPICPHCQTPLEKVLKTGGALADQIVYFCPHCKKVLGFGKWG
jgi:transposase-like protein